jgi:signal transduction histidine kinase
MLLDQFSGLISNAVYDVGRWNGEWHIGMEGGWQRMKEGKFISYTSHEGFKGKRAMYSFADKKGRIFVLSEKYLMRVEGDRLRTLYSQPILTLKSSSLTMAWFDTASQNLWCASTDGLMKLYIPAVQTDTSRFNPVLYDCVVNGSRVKVNPMETLMVPSGSGNGLELKCGFDKIDISKESMLYFQLEGRSADWLPVRPDFELRFSLLQPGMYTLYMYAVNPDGVESLPQKMLQFRVPYPWYLKWYMVLLYLLVAGLLTWLTARFWANRRLEGKMRRFVLEQKIQEERNRISSELHDNVGSQLTNIIAQLDFVEGALQMGRNDTALKKVETLQEKARRTMTLLRESIWALKEDAISLQDFMLKVQQYAANVFEADSGVQVNILAIPQLKDKLSPWQAVNLLRVVQEAFQNIQKHALGVTSVVIETSLPEGVLHMAVKDNGCGFDVYRMVPGQGMGNMQRRMTEMHGAFRLESGPAGTSLVLELPLKKSP